MLDKIAIFKLLHENECEDGKMITSEIEELYDDLDYGISLGEFMIRSTKVRWLMYSQSLSLIFNLELPIIILQKM